MPDQVMTPRLQRADRDDLPSQVDLAAAWARYQAAGIDLDPGEQQMLSAIASAVRCLVAQVEQGLRDALPTQDNSGG